MRPERGRGQAPGEGLRAKRSLGQNFLVDRNVARKIVGSLAAEPGDLVVEIGPGHGALTRLLAELPDVRLMALEKDTALAVELRETLPEVTVVTGDALTYPWESLGADNAVRIIGNLPYNVASPIIWDLAARCPGMRRAVFMIQREVAERLCARPGGGAYGGLTAWVQSFVSAAFLFRVGPEVFRPRPKVDSAVIALTPLPEDARAADPEALAAVIKHCFTWRRKQLQKILKAFPAKMAERFFIDEGVAETARPEELSPKMFQKLAELYRIFVMPAGEGKPAESRLAVKPP